MNYFFHASIRNYTIALLDLFNDMHVPRYNSEGERIEDITVPIKFGNRDKAYYLNEHDIENLINGNVNTLPRMVLEFNSLDKAPERDTNKLQKINKRMLGDKDNPFYYEYLYNSVAYDFNYTLYLATRTFTDATILIEQIAPMFRPDLSMKIQELDIQENPTTVPVTLGGIEVDLPDELAEEDIRIVETSLTLTLKGNLYLPIMDEKIIRDVELRMEVQDTELTEKGKEYEFEYYPSTLNSEVDDDLGEIKESKDDWAPSNSNNPERPEV